MVSPSRWARRNAALARGDGTYEKKLLRFTSPSVLILDDLGLRHLQGDEPIDLYEVTRARYERGSLIVTSNRALEEWYPLFKDDLRVIDRITIDHFQGKVGLFETIEGKIHSFEETALQAGRLNDAAPRE